MVCNENRGGVPSLQTLKVSSVALLFAAVIAGCGGEASVGNNSADADSASGAASAPHPGEKIYGEYCFSCHSPGLNGAPKLGDAEAWAPRVAKGAALMLEATIEGIPPAMPPRGICMSCSDEELAAAIDYMVVNSQ